MGRQGTAWTAPFLEQLAAGASVPAACRAVGVVPATAYEHRHRHPDFGAAWDAVKAGALPAAAEPDRGDGTFQIPLRRKDGTIAAYAIVDADDYPRVSGPRWFLDDSGYARRSTSIGSRSDGTRRVVAFQIHRVILGLEHGDPRQGDHINGNRLDNRRSNLRIVAGLAEQAQNRGSHDGSSSRHRGVSWHKQHRKWYACAQVAGRQRFLGLFDDEDEAARVVAEYRREHMPYTVDR